MNTFGFFLNAGDIVHLNQPILGVYQSSTWKTGYYLVESIRPGAMTHRSDWHKPAVQVYAFKKVKKDGTPFKTFMNGYSALAFDQFIRDGKATIYRRA